jgi:hypothetical protein
MKRIILMAVLGAVLTAGAIAEAHHRPSHSHGKNPSANSKRCSKPAKVAFVLSGTWLSNSGNTVEMDVTRANRHARRAGFSDPFSATATKSVRLRGYEEGETPDSDDKVHAVGKVERFRRGCDNPTTTDESDRYGAVTIRKFVIHDRDPEEQGS